MGKKVDVVKKHNLANNTWIKSLKKKFYKSCPLLDELYTIEECVLTRGRQGKQRDVGIVYVHKGVKPGTLRVGGTERHYNKRAKDTDKKEYADTNPILILLCDDVDALEYALHRTLDTKKSHVYPKKGETYADMYQRVIHAFLFYDTLCRRGLTSYFHRLVSLQHLDDWVRNLYILPNEHWLYLNNNTHNVELENDTHLHVGLDDYYDADYPKQIHFKPYLRLPVHMRYLKHKNAEEQVKIDAIELDKIYDTIEELSSIY